MNNFPLALYKVEPKCHFVGPRNEFLAQNRIAINFHPKFKAYLGQKSSKYGLFVYSGQKKEENKKFLNKSILRFELVHKSVGLWMKGNKFITCTDVPMKGIKVKKQLQFVCSKAHLKAIRKQDEYQILLTEYLGKVSRKVLKSESVSSSVMSGLFATHGM